MKALVQGKEKEEIPSGLEISFPIWGKSYVEPFSCVTLKNVAAPGNGPAVAEQTKFGIRFYTTRADAKTIRRSPGFRFLERHGEMIFNTEIEKNLGDSLPLAAMNWCQRHAITAGFQKNKILVPMTGDAVITENLLSTGYYWITKGYRMVVGAGLRLNRAAILAKAPSLRTSYWAISNEQAVQFALNHRHIYSKRQTLGSKRFIFSAELYSEQKNLLYSRCFCLAPFALWPKKLPTLPVITFDDSFIDELYPDTKEIKILQNVQQEGAIFSLTSEKEYHNNAPKIQTRFSPIRYARKIHSFFVEGNLGNTHNFYFTKPIWYQKTKTGLSKQKTQEMSAACSAISTYFNVFCALAPPKKKPFCDKKIKKLLRIFEMFPFLYLLFADQGTYRDSYKNLLDRSGYSYGGIIFYSLLGPILSELAFVLDCFLKPWALGTWIKKHSSTYPPSLLASGGKKIRNLTWPLVAFFLQPIGATGSLIKVAFLRFYGSRCSWDTKIHRGVYFKNPWNLIIRRHAEIYPEVLIDCPSETIEVGWGCRIGSRAYLASTRATPAEWRSDAINSRISISSFSRIPEYAVIIPKLR